MKYLYRMISEVRYHPPRFRIVSLKKSRRSTCLTIKFLQKDDKEKEYNKSYILSLFICFHTCNFHTLRPLGRPIFCHGIGTLSVIVLYFKSCSWTIKSTNNMSRLKVKKNNELSYQPINQSFTITPVIENNYSKLSSKLPLFRVPGVVAYESVDWTIQKGCPNQVAADTNLFYNLITMQKPFCQYKNNPVNTEKGVSLV